MKPAPPVTKIVEPLKRMIYRLHAVESTLVRAGNGLQIFAIAAFRGLLGDLLERLKRDVALPQRDLFRAGDAQALALFEDLHEMAGLNQRGMRAGVEPGKAA